MAAEAVEAEVAAEGRAATAWVVDWPFTGPTRAWSFLTVQTLPLECPRLPCGGSMDLTVSRRVKEFPNRDNKISISSKGAST